MTIRSIWTWLAARASDALVWLLLLVALAGWTFFELVDEVRDGATDAFDRAMLLALRTPGDPADPLGPPWVEELGRDVTALGGTGILTFVTLAAAGFLWLHGRRITMLFLLGAVGGGSALSTLAKHVIDRPRPDLVPHGSYVYTASFPSGHSLISAVTYLTLAVLVARDLRQTSLKVYVVAIAILLTLSVGVSRVYLGVHWPTDVLAGWAAGAGWAIACATLARYLARRGRIEPERTEQDGHP